MFLFGQQKDSLKTIATKKFKVFFAELKEGTKDDSSHYTLSHFSNLEKKYAYPIGIIEMGKMIKYSSPKSFYEAYFIRKLNPTSKINLSALQPKIRKTFQKLSKKIERGKQEGQHNLKKEQRLSKKINRLIDKHKPPFSGYFQEATIDIKYPHSEKKYVFLIEYSMYLDVVNFGTPTTQ